MPGSPTSTDVNLLPAAPVLLPPLAATSPPPRQLAELPRDELSALADEFGIDPTRFKTNQLLVAAIHDRRHLIASLDRGALLDIARWGRRPVAVNASKEHLAQEIARIRSMKFSGLSHPGLLALAQLRGIPVKGVEPVPVLVKKLRKREGVFARFLRMRRAMVASLVARVVGDQAAADEFQFLPPTNAPGVGPSTVVDPGSRSNSLKEEIEESGLFGGLTNRIKKTADSYVNQKLDEIESRIDRKLDEIDRRLGDWRDKEIANRIRILKITLWASVIVGIFTLVYSYVKVYLVGW